MVARCSLRTVARALVGVELRDRGRHERREQRVEVRDAVDDLSLGVDAEVAGVLADQPVPVVAALGVLVGDADQRPVHRDLLRPQRVGAQRATAGLHDRGDRGDRGDVGEPGDPLRVPALAEQRSGADEDLAVAVLEVRRDQARPTAGAPTGRRSAGAVEPAPSGSTRSDAARSRSGSQARNAVQRGRGAGDRLAGDEHRVEPAGLRGGDQRLEHRVGRAGLLVDDPGEVRGQRRSGALVVAEDQHPHPLGEVEVLVGADLDDGGGLRRRAGQHPVDRAATAADAALGPLVADRRQRAAYRLDDLLVLGQPGLGEPAGQPVVDQQHPVVRGRRRAVLLLHPGAARQPDHPDVVQPQHRAAHVRLLLDQREPRRPAGHEPRVQPLQERHRAERRVGELGDQLPEPLGLLLQPVVLARRRGGQPGQLDERRQVADLDHRRDRDPVERRAEQLVDEERLVGGERLGRGRGEPEHQRVGQLVEQLADQAAPHLEQVVALVEDQQQRPAVLERLQLLDERAAVLVQPVQQDCQRLGTSDGGRPVPRLEPWVSCRRRRPRRRGRRPRAPGRSAR